MSFLLEVIDVEERQGERAAVALRAAELPPEGLEEVPLRRCAGQSVRHHERVHRLVVLGLDVSAGEEFEVGGVDLEAIPVAEDRRGEWSVFEHGAVRGTQIAEEHGSVLVWLG